MTLIEVEFKESDKPYSCQLCSQPLRYCHTVRRVVEVESIENCNQIIAYNHNCRKLEGRKIATLSESLFGDQIDPLEYAQQQKFRFADQRRKEAIESEQRSIEAGRRHKEEIHHDILQEKLELAEKRIAKLEQENKKLKEQQQQ
jgi:hypothetical protein